MSPKLKFLIALLFAVLFGSQDCFANPADGSAATVAHAGFIPVPPAILGLTANFFEIFLIAYGARFIPLGTALLFLPDRRMLGILFLMGGIAFTAAGLSVAGLFGSPAELYGPTNLPH